LFNKVQRGEIRVLIGSTFKLGLGVNVQNKLIALHHLDVPWRPADMTQREGRILRQGNENKKVMIYRYITEGSFDAYSWQLLETKERFITDILSGSIDERSGSDIDNTVLNYAEVKALAVGNPLIKERVETANELTRLRSLQRKIIEARTSLETELMELPAKISYQQGIIAKCESDVSYSVCSNHDYTKEERKEIREQIYKAVKANVLGENEELLLSYRGFEVFLPANMAPEKYFVWLKRAGKYYVELGDTEIGGLIRIDNFIDNIDKHLDKLKCGLEKYFERENDIRQELTREESYADEIMECKRKLEGIDKKLGVEKK